MAEVLFYHLQSQPLEAVLPALLERCFARGWRTVVEIGSPERLAALDAELWSYAEESFLPHGTDAEARPERQPILLTNGPGNPNGATVRFFVDGARPASIEGYERVVLLFDGTDEDAVEAARAEWKRLKAEGAPLTYWQQDEGGRWVKKA